MKQYKFVRDVKTNEIGLRRGFHWNYTGRFEYAFREGEMVAEVECEKPSWIPSDEIYVATETGSSWWIPREWVTEESHA